MITEALWTILKEQHGSVYEASLKGLIDQLSIDMKRKDINFVIGRLSDYSMKNPNWVAVRQAQVAVAEASLRGAWVDTDDLNDGLNKKGEEIKNDLHCSVEGFKTHGKSFAEKAIALIQNESNKTIDSDKK